MFALKSLSKYLFGDSSREDIVELPVGALFIVRPHSPKGYSELIFKDAAAVIRRTGQEFQYQLVIQRAYEEGEAELLEDEGGGEDGGDGGGASSDKDEKTFLLDPELGFRVGVKEEDGATVLAWRDWSGDEGDLFEFVCDPATTRADAAAGFELVAAQCQYERKYRRSAQHATPRDLSEFTSDRSLAIPAASPASSPIARSPAALSPSSPITRSLPDRRAESDMVRGSASKALTPTRPKPSQPAATKAPTARAAPDSREELARADAELHLFDFQSGTFILQDAHVQALVLEVGEWKYWLQITGDAQQWLGQAVVPDINPVFNFEYLSFIFNHYTEDGSAYSWLLKFPDRATEEGFQEGLMQALWEHLNGVKWSKAVKDADREYVLDAFNDLVLEDSRDDRREAEAAEEDEQEEEDDYEDADEGYRGQRPEDNDEDEDEDEVVVRDKDGNVNSQLAVGAKVDRSFVVRGDKIGVFKHTADNQLDFSTTISKIATPKGKAFAPKKVMLHAEDRNMILQGEHDPHSLYRMDLEYGKVVDEWKVHDDIPVHLFAPERKFAQTTGEQTFLGLSHNALYRVDPRLAGHKLVPAELKQYAGKNAFSAAATTASGHIAVASDKGDIRLFDRLGINAKTALPALGDPITGLDVSADGRWVLATTRTYLLLLDARHDPAGPNAGRLGFEKSFAKDAKPAPRRLALTPSHVAQFHHETGAPLAFTPARFDAAPGQPETSIITATGPYVVTWSLAKVLAGRRDPYAIKRYPDNVQADDFQFGAARHIVVALPDQVDLLARKALQRPSRDSIAAVPRTPRGLPSAARRSYLGRGEVVNSPY